MLLYCTSFDHYGTGEAVSFFNSGFDLGWDFSSETTNVFILGDTFTQSPISPIGNNTTIVGTWGIGAPAWGARRGDYALYAAAPRVQNQSSGGQTFSVTNQASMRMAIPGASQHERIIHVAFSCDDLIPDNLGGKGVIMCLGDASGGLRGRIGYTATGRLAIFDGGNISSGVTGEIFEDMTLLAVGAAPVIVPETWVSLSIKIITNAVDLNADIEIYQGDIIPNNLVLSATVELENTTSKQIDEIGWLPASNGGRQGAVERDETTRYVRDIVICDNTGTYNNDHLGQVFVAAQQMRAEDNEGSNWTSRPRENIGTGIIDGRERGGLSIPDNANLELGAGDFTIEGWWKLDEINIAPDVTVLASKWDEANDQRSWILDYDDASSRFRFRISTDGVTPVTLFTYPFTPEKQRYYHVAVSRDTAVTRVFIDGVQIGQDQADSNTYFDGTARLGVLGRFDGSTIDADSAASAWVDEFRLTVGLSRYSADFTPSAVPFGRNGVDDANFTNVEFLLGGDGSITDESDNVFTVTAGTGTVSQLPDDGDTSYEVLNQRPPWDDSYIEARNTFAYNILQLDANPLDGEQVTLGADTYTFKTTLTPTAFEVLIGPTARDSMEHLVNAVNAGTGSGTDYAAGTTVNTDVFAEQLPDEQGLFTATNIGVAGNSVVSTETLTSGAFLYGATLDFGEDIPSPSDFAIERLPADVTGVLGVQVTARGYKSDAGSANLRFDLKGPGAAVDVGVAQGTDLNPSWLRQIFEEDPDTASGITPSTVVGGRVRVTRTT